MKKGVSTMTVSNLSKDEQQEFQFYDWEKQYGREEAIQIASEEWGYSTYVIQKKVEEWESWDRHLFGGE